MSRVYNFGAGPATLPESVLKKARDELLEWHATGISVMEMGHHSKEFESIVEQAESDLRELLDIPASYKVLFLAGGGTGQFAAVPLNLGRDNAKFAYVHTGQWSGKAIVEARRYGEVQVAASSEKEGFTHIPARAEWQFDSDVAYLHYTANETISGVEFQSPPEIGDIPLVADMSSNICSRPIDVNQFGIIYAGAQKNLGSAGITIVIVRDDLIGHAHPFTPSIFDYQLQANAHSIFNTPPTYSWYMLGLELEWLKEQGGIAEVEKRNIRKAEKIYSVLDASSFYLNNVESAVRSRMNIPFLLADKNLEQTFLAKAKENGLVNLAGYRTIGGLRASIYNAMSEEGVDKLVAFMREFERTHG